MHKAKHWRVHLNPTQLVRVERREGEELEVRCPVQQSGGRITAKGQVIVEVSDILWDVCGRGEKPYKPEILCLSRDPC